MKTITCDFCRNVINDDEKFFNLKFIRTFKVLWFRRDIGYFDTDEICESCFSKFLKVYDDFKCEVKNENTPF